MVGDASASTISSILISLERLLADALAGQALPDPRWPSNVFVNVSGAFVPESAIELSWPRSFVRKST
jgi:hypothetical protein